MNCWSVGKQRWINVSYHRWINVGLCLDLKLALHPRIVNELSHTICTPLSIIYNQSIVSGTLPSQWKTANITAIHKKGSKSLASNYRPISLTCIVCKILESIIRDAVMKHMIKNNLLSNKQYDFISGWSTVLQLLHVLDTWMDITR